MEWCQEVSGMSMMDATERTRPVMQYVRDLETRVRHYQNIERRFNLRCFLVGFLLGGAATSLVFFLRWFQQLK
jgi:hypothetical protein